VPAPGLGWVHLCPAKRKQSKGAPLNRRRAVPGVLRPQAFTEVVRDEGGQSWKTGLCVIGLSVWAVCHQHLSYVMDGGVWAVGGSVWAVIFCGLQGPQLSKTLLCVTSHSIISGPGCDSLSASSHGSQPSDFLSLC
jgi:hypothetical protein